jgi:hypothetical protein
MRKEAQEQIDRLEAAKIDNYDLYNSMMQIVEECQTDSSTEYIYEQYFELGQFTADKRAITKLINKMTYQQQDTTPPTPVAVETVETAAPTAAPLMKVDKRAAREAYSKGQKVWLYPSKMYFNPNDHKSPGLLASWIWKSQPAPAPDDAHEFEKAVNAFSFYNCTNEAGRYPHYYIDTPAPQPQPEQLYKVYKVGRKSYRRTILYRNLSLDEARRTVNRYPDSTRSMVVFAKM